MSKPDVDPIFKLISAADAPELYAAITKLVSQRDDFKEWNYSEVRCEGQDLYRAVYVASLNQGQGSAAARQLAAQAMAHALEDLTQK